MKRHAAAASLLIALGLLLGGCELPFWDWDPLNVSGRDGGGKPLDYPTVMRVAAAAHAGGDLPTAVGLYRRAGLLEPLEPAPFVAAGNTLLEMGEVNEAIVAYNS